MLKCEACSTDTENGLHSEVGGILGYQESFNVQQQLAMGLQLSICVVAKHIYLISITFIRVVPVKIDE